MTPKEYQPLLKQKLQGIYPDQDVEIEWTSIRVDSSVYSPRVDAAVGPFATEQQYIEEYSNLLEASGDFIHKVIKKHNENLKSF